mgnify:CR=1 FL=1
MRKFSQCNLENDLSYTLNVKLTCRVQHMAKLQIATPCAIETPDGDALYSHSLHRSFPAAPKNIAGPSYDSVTNIREAPEFYRYL